MKTVRLILFFTLLFSASFAQNNALDGEADALLKMISAKYQKYTTAKFDLKLIIDLPEVEENQIVDVTAWLKGDKFKIELKDQTFVSDNVTLWNYLKEYNEVQISNLEESDAMFSPSILFNLYSKDYAYRIKEEFKNSEGNLIKVVELTPIKKDQDFFKIDIRINTASNTISEARIYEKSGMRYTYKINSLTPNITLSDDFFIFDISKYKGVEVIDARF